MQQHNTEQNNAASTGILLCYLQADLLAPSSPGGRAPHITSTSLQRAQGDPHYPSPLATNEIGIPFVHFLCCYKSAQLLVYSGWGSGHPTLFSFFALLEYQIQLCHSFAACIGITVVAAEMCSLEVSSCASLIRKANVLKMLFRERKSFMTGSCILLKHKNCRVSWQSGILHKQGTLAHCLLYDP